MKLPLKKMLAWFCAAAVLQTGFAPVVSAGLTREEKQILADVHETYQAVPEGDLSGSLRLEELLQFGLGRNSEVRASFYEWKAAAHAVRPARSWEDPQVSFKTFLDSVETRVGPQEAAWSFSQKVPFPGKTLLRGRAAEAVSRQARADYEKARLRYLYELRDAWFEYWFLHKQLLVTEQNMELLRHFEEVAQSKYKSGREENIDLLKAQVELGRLQNDLLTLEDYRAPLSARLNAVLGRDVLLPLGEPEEPAHRLVILNEEQVFEKFRQNNPDLKKASRRIEEAGKKVWLARLDYLPDVTVGFDYIQVGRGPMNAPDNGDDAAALMFKVNVPLWYGKQKGRLDEARARETAAESDEEQLVRDLGAAVRMILYRIKNAERQILLYRDALVPKAEQALKAAETAYSAGRVDFLNLIDSERTLIEFQLAYYRAIRDYEQRFAELEMMVGESLRA